MYFFSSGKNENETAINITTNTNILEAAGLQRVPKTAEAVRQSPAFEIASPLKNKAKRSKASYYCLCALVQYEQSFRFLFEKEYQY